MALKRNQVLQEEINNKQDASSLDCQKKIEHCRFRILDIILYVFSIGIILTNIVTDIIVTAEYFLRGCLVWFYLEIGILFMPTSLIQILSLKWHQEDGNIKKIHWISHALLLGILYRYIVLLKEVLRSFNSKYSAKSKAWLLKNENIVYTLHLFLSFIVSVPQLIFQLYLIAKQQNVPFWTGASAATSLCSITWAISGYIKFKLGTHWNHQKSKWSALIVQLCWRGGLLASRITALVLAAFFLESWLFVFSGIHSLIMTIWITFQNIPSPKLWEKYTFNYILGLVYFFDIFLVNSDYLWYRICSYYILIMFENVTLLIVFTFYIRETLNTNLFVISYILILGGSFFGLASMFLYYRKFNYDTVFKESLQLSKHVNIFKDDKNIQSDTLKSNKNKSLVSLPLSSDISPVIALSEEVTADKKSLLTNIEQNTESVERGILNSSFAQSDAPEEIPHVIIETLDSPNSLKKYEAKIDEIVETKKTDSKAQQEGVVTISRENSDKRRGICSLTQLVTDVDNYVEKTFSLSSYEDKDKFKGFKVVPLAVEDSSDDLYVVPENIKGRLRMNTPVISEVNEATDSEKTLESNSQKDETMSQITSIHDYENLCPLGVARPPWCIRSWQGYTDIETYIHDDSIIRDRRRDTLTSTATATTLSSDFSDGTYSSSPFKRIMKNSRQDDYLDTLVYDLVDWESNVFNEEDTASKFQGNEDSNLFAAKPIVIDDRGGMLSLDTIFEEHEDLASSSESSFDPKQKTTVSSLVATIDEIRKQAAENSPRHVYHRTEKQYEDLSHCILMKNSPLHSRNNSNSCTENAWNLLFIRDNPLDISSLCSRVSMRKTPLISAILSDSPVLEPRTKTEKYVKEDICLLDDNNIYVEMKALKVENFSNSYKEFNDSLCDVIKDTTEQTKKEHIPENEGTILEIPVEVKNFSNQDNLCDSPLKITTSKVDSIENLSPTLNSPRVGTSLSNEKRRRSICRPRRKFSLLREKFEVKSRQVSNQSILSGNKKILRDLSSLDIYESAVTYEKENLPDCKNVEEKRDHMEDVRCNLKERRSLFLKQVLSPPKFQNWSRKKAFGPSAEIIPKAL